MSDPASLSTPARSIAKVKYFPVELYCTNLIPNTQYNIFANNINVNQFCKPFGGKLGSPLVSNSSGMLIIQYMAAAPYIQQYLVNPSSSNGSISPTKTTITLVDPFNNSSTGYITVNYKTT
jgi:hypothetical protein